MADVHDKATRRKNMQAIKAKDTKPELLVRKFLHAQGFRYRLHSRHLPGTPDIVLPKYRTVIFIHSCFFHGHDGCKYFVIPKTRTEWWQEKIAGNKRNDAKSAAALIEAGWRVLVVWECELKPAVREGALAKLLWHLS